MWEKLDRILQYSDPFGTWAHKRMLELAEDIDHHLAMVFHRFLAGEIDDKKLSITVNGSNVEPWDPFCRDESTTIVVSDIAIPVSSSGGSGMTHVRSFVLPHQNEFSSRAAWGRASGPLKWNRQQGLYIYRANRLIQSGGWNRMRTVEEHNKLARMALDFFPDLDSAFSLNIMKASVSLPEDLRKHLDPVIKRAIEVAKQTLQGRIAFKAIESNTCPHPQRRYNRHQRFHNHQV